MEHTVFTDKVAVVTGAGGTLCSEIAIDLASKGARVVLIGRSREKLEKTAAVIEKNGGQYLIMPCDVNDEAAMQAIADEIYAKWGACTYLINGAGGNNIMAMTTYTEYNPAEEGEHEGERGLFDLDINMFETVLKTNTLGTVIPSRIFAKQMVKNGGGSILNFASMNSYRPLTRVPAYAMSKAAIVNFTQWLAAYLAPAGIRVNAVAPGFFVNERSRQYLGSVEDGLTARGQRVIAHTPMANFGEARDLLGCVEWLLDPEKASFVTGITVPVDGGFLTQPGI